MCRTESVAGIAYTNNGTMAVIEHMRPVENALQNLIESLEPYSIQEGVFSNIQE